MRCNKIIGSGMCNKPATRFWKRLNIRIIIGQRCDEHVPETFNKLVDWVEITKEEAEVLEIMEL